MCVNEMDSGEMARLNGPCEGRLEGVSKNTGKCVEDGKSSNAL